MNKYLIAFVCFFGVSYVANAQTSVVRLSDDLYVEQISANVYVHISFMSDPQWGRFPSNGVIYMKGKEAMLFDTPGTDSLTHLLLDWIEITMQSRLVAFVPNHWHNDCMGGLEVIHQRGVASYAHQLTCSLARENNLLVPMNSFSDSLSLLLNNSPVFCYYPGPAHSMDNIVVWIPEEKVLFAGCMAKELASRSMGNVADGDLKAWPATIKKIQDRYSDAKIVVPGHGAWAGPELLEHTFNLAVKFASDTHFD